MEGFKIPLLKILMNIIPAIKIPAGAIKLRISKYQLRVWKGFKIPTFKIPIKLNTNRPYKIPTDPIKIPTDTIKK